MNFRKENLIVHKVMSSTKVGSVNNPGNWHGGRLLLAQSSTERVSYGHEFFLFSCNSPFISFFWSGLMYILPSNSMKYYLFLWNEFVSFFAIVDVVKRCVAHAHSHQSQNTHWQCSLTVEGEWMLFVICLCRPRLYSSLCMYSWSTLFTFSVSAFIKLMISV